MTPDSEDAPAALPASIHPALAEALEAHGYAQLTPVQLAVLEDERDEADLLVSAQTGSGKTVAFGLAIAQTLLGDDPAFGAAGLPLGLIIAPTRELAMQVQRELEWLYAPAGVRIATCVGGMDARDERRVLERGVHIVVGTPGRLRDHITRRALDLGELRAVVLDEADEMLDLGFREDLEFILDAAPESRRTLLFSATVPKAIAELASTFQRDAQRITAGALREPHADIEYQLMLVKRDEREHAIINTLLGSDSRSALVFCHTREAVRHLTARLANRGFSVVALSGELAQSERTSALQAMRDGRAHVCVATDVAARGIDLPNLDLVIHADLPSNPATLLHRSGRTGRAGRKGICVLVVPENRRGAANRVLSLANLSATLRQAPDILEIEARYRDQIREAALAEKPPTEVEAEFISALVKELTPEQLAVALVRGQLATRPVPEEVSPVDLKSAALGKKPRRERDFDAPAPGGGGSREGFVREPRGPDMVGGVWFTVSVGRKQRADPKWLLPMICKAGGVTKKDVGSIRIEDTETRFEISADMAGDFADHMSQPGSVEKGIYISRADGAPGGPRPARSKPAGDFKPRPKGEFKPGPKGDFKPRGKGEFKAAGKTAYDPAKSGGKPAYKGGPGDKPRTASKPAGKSLFAGKDKGKPKYKGKAKPARD